MRQWYLITYDVRDDRRLRLTARTLLGFGERMQYSVFRCHLSDRDLQRLRWELARVMTKEDSLLVVPLCKGCVSRMRHLDGSSGWPSDPQDAVVL
jgi:CRISPR-associated protein Cas2